MIRIAARHAAGLENGSPAPIVHPELVEVTTRLAGVLRDLEQTRPTGRDSVPADPSDSAIPGMPLIRTEQ
ncbi:MAG: hypothetical protein ACYC61_29380 [Isosphaeraceae bacterium]